MSSVVDSVTLIQWNHSVVTWSWRQ